MDKMGLVILLLPALSTLSLGVSREYHYVPLLRSWSSAQRYCRENFVDLATIQNEEDWASVRKIMETADRLVYIGLHINVNSWMWSMDDTYLYSDGNTNVGAWFDFDNRHQHLCVKINGQRLYDYPCHYAIKSVCYDESTNTYIPVTVLMMWSSAQSYCREKYTDLASMRNQQEKEAIMSVIDESSWWIGLFRKYRSWSDQSNTAFRLWRGSEPNGGRREPCVCTLLDGWADLDCGRKLPFICSVPIVTLFKVVLKVEGPVDVNDPNVHQALLNYWAKNMSDHGIQQFTLSWRKQPNGKIFKKRV